jgi:asparagine synthase (glutamine-hydrolysing)
MCGICGAVWNEPSKLIHRTTLETMTHLLRHRGPDDSGTFLQQDRGIALGHRRLSIIDLSPLGRQPMSNENETIWIVFNGEIYNFESLRSQLIQHGHHFRSNSDTEVLVHLYEEEHENMLQHLNGMFAFAVWDVCNRQLFLARDHIGKKPLYYRQESNRLIFASELKSVLSVNGVPRDLDFTALDDYLTYQYVPHPKTIFRGISKLSPGHFAVWKDGQLTVRRYWNPDWNDEDNQLSFDEWSEELRALAADAVRIRLRSDVPIGAFLSGGIDSSITDGLMQQESSQQIQTFCIGFPQEEYDETKYARQAATSFNTKHREFIVTQDIDDILPKLVWHYDEPFADSSAIPTWYLCEMTRREVSVALSGDGGDEMFAGYDRYRAVQWGRLAEYLPLFLRRFLAGPVRNLIPASTRQRSTLRRLKRFLEAFGMEPLEQYLQWIAIFNRERRQNLYTADFLQQLHQQPDCQQYDSLNFLREAERCCFRRDRVTRIALTDLLTYLPCDLMTKVDRASMAHGLECRSPLLDHRITEWAAKLPIRYKIEGNRGKKILRETFRNLLPPNIGQRRKMGFGVPIDHWFRGALRNTVRDVLLDPKTLQRGFFKQKFVEQLLNDHFANRFDHAYRIWALLVFELWQRQWCE